MSRRREIAEHLASLEDIAGILVAMKNLALMETQRLTRALPAQERLVAGIEETGADLLFWCPEFAPPPGSGQSLFLLIGSEQPFCGDYNERLARVLPDLDGPCITLGQRLADRLGEDARIVQQLPGATVSEEIPATLLHLTDTLVSLLSRPELHGAGLCVLYHDPHDTELRQRALLPVTGLPAPTHTRVAPDLYLAADELWLKLTEQYLYATLNRILYGALLAENRQRLGHMERALNRIDERRHELGIAYNAERQEEIVEEIEVIVLSADLFQDRPL